MTTCTPPADAGQLMTDEDLAAARYAVSSGDCAAADFTTTWGARGFAHIDAQAAQRKNMWGLSEDADHRAPHIFQHMLLRAKWDADAVRDDVLEYARREGGILAVDETGLLQRRDRSVGVARQYTGTAGKV
ncbi:hypothetical protein HI292_33820 [Corallococcus exiguus]|nr:hypothetical protein [Corallococcus exiguus]